MHLPTNLNITNIKYKWLDYSRFADLFVPKNEKLVDILYFTSLTTWDPEKAARHKIFIRALELRGVRVVYGAFRIRDRHCPLCNRNYRSHEEKQTDINIAIYLLKFAIEDKYDKALIVSGDSDLIPSVKAVRDAFPSKRIGVIIPIGRRAEGLKGACDFYMKIKEKHLKASRFDEEIDLGNGERLVCPPSWH